MKFYFKLVSLLLLLFLTQLSFGASSEALVYVVTLSTGYTHTGMVIPLSALFYQPVSVDSNWQYLGRPNNRIYNVDFHRLSKGKMIAMATHTGVHQSFDFGKTWKLTTDWRMTEVNSIAIDQKNSEIIYAGSPYGFYKTINKGKSWEKCNNGLESIDAQFVTAIVIDFSNPERIFCSTEDGVFISNDAAKSWRRTDISIRNIRVVVQHPANPKILVAGTEDNGLYFTTDGGNVWEKRDNGVGHSTFYAIAFDPNNQDVIYAGGYQTGVYKSIDGGMKWTRSHKGLDNLNIHAVAVTPNDSKRIYAGTMGNGVYMSEDGGKSWKYIGIKNGYVSAIKIESF